MNIDPQTAVFLESLKAEDSPHSGEPSVELARRQQSKMQEVPALKRPLVDILDRNLPVGPKGSVEVRVVWPPNTSRLLGAAMYFHGGGWVVGGKDTHDRLIREIAVRANVVVVFVDYARSPEARYPVALEEAYAATQWVADFGEELGIDTSRIAVVGDSSGGNMAAAVALLAKERQGPELAAQLLFFPTLSASFDTASYAEFAEGPFLTLDLMRWFWDQYAPDAEARNQMTASPLLAPVDKLRGLPPALIVTAENDVLRDEGEAYAHKLMEAGVQTSAMRYLGTIHAFVFLNGLADTPAAQAALEQAISYLRVAFVASPSELTAPSRVFAVG